ncbi:MAG: hypothetical protein ACOQNY_01725 [Mycoplasmoidaceae bacterium]
MKKLYKLIPLTGVACSALIPIASLTSCKKESILTELDWDVQTQGVDAYDGRPTADEYTFLTYKEATQWYFDEVAKDYSIFAYDIIHMLTHNLHEWAYNFLTSAGNPYGLDIYEMKCTHANVKLYKWDTVSHRISFDMEVLVSNEDGTATGECKFSWINHPAAISRMNPDEGKRSDETDQEWYPLCIHDSYHNSTPWRLMPEGCAHYLHTHILGELVDPYYPGGSGCGHVEMSMVDDWEMILDETYHLPNDTERKFYIDYTPSWYSQFTSTCFDDPEVFNYVKYIMTTFYMNSPTYVHRIKEAFWDL